MPCWTESCEANRFCPTRAKCIRIHIDRNHIIQVHHREEGHHGHGHACMHGLKCSWLWNFTSIFCGWVTARYKKKNCQHLSRCHIHLPSSIVSVRGRGPHLIGRSSRLSSSVPFSSGLKSPFGTRYTVFFLHGSKMEFNNGRPTRHTNIAESGLLLSVPFHISPQKHSCSCGSLCTSEHVKIHHPG